MKGTRIYLSPPHISGRELEYVQEAFSSNWIAPFGPQLNLFQEALQTYTGSPFIELVNSGTSAIHLSLIACDIHKDDVVFCPAFTFAATIFPVLYQKAVPVFIDSEADTWNMDPVLLEQAIVETIKAGKKPKAIILVHIYGFPAKIKEILQLVQKYNLLLIEDAAESLGATYGGCHTGTFGHTGILSFNGNKLITTGGGGAVMTGDKVLSERISLLANQAKEDKPYYEHLEVGYNYRLSNVSAAVGAGQLESIESKIKRKKEIRAQYKQNFGSLVQVKESVIGIDNAWLTCIILPDYAAPETIRLILEEHNIESRRLWNPMHRQPVFKSCDFYLNGISDKLFNTGLCIPSGTTLDAGDIDRISNIITSAL